MTRKHHAFAILKSMKPPYLSLLAICSIGALSAMPWAAVEAGNLPVEKSPSWAECNSNFAAAVSANTRYTCREGELELSEGSLLVEARSPLVIRTPLSIIDLKRKGLVFLRVNPGSERFLLFLESARIICGKHFVQLSAGEEAIVADREMQYREILAEDAIGRRRARVVKMGTGKGLAMTEFSIVQAMEREPLIYQVVHSNTPHDQALKDRLIKTAAVLNAVTSRHGEYTSGNR